MIRRGGNRSLRIRKVVMDGIRNRDVGVTIEGGRSRVRAELGIRNSVIRVLGKRS